MSTLSALGRWDLFCVTTALNLLLTMTSAVYWTIQIALRYIAYDYRAVQGSNTEELDAGHPFGRVVGFIEREIYLYACLGGNPGLITPVIIMKAFFGWLTFRRGSNDAFIFGRFYSYIVGNLISLIWALALYELVLAPPVTRLLIRVVG